MPTYSAALRVMGKELDPNEISLLLGIRPDESHRRGDPHLGKEGRRYADFAEGLWSLKSPLPPKAQLVDHLTYLITALGGNAESLRVLRQRDLRIDIFIGVFDLGDNSGFDLPAEVLKTTGSLGIDLAFDLYTL